MIRKFDAADLDTVMKIWLEANTQAHFFIPESYWVGKFNIVRNMLPQAEVYVWERENKIEAFVGIDRGYIAGIFVSGAMRSQGIGKFLLDRCKEIYEQLSLAVYEKNHDALKFYFREGFTVETRQNDSYTGEIEFSMTWNRRKPVI